MSAGRVGIVSMCVANMIKAVVIAIRYSAVRKQFGPDEKELPVIEYQMQQWRLFPYLAAAYVMKFFADYIYDDFVKYVFNQMPGEDKEKLAMLGAEIHAVSSSAKPLAGWLARDAIQECREGNVAFEFRVIYASNSSTSKSLLFFQFNKHISYL